MSRNRERLRLLIGFKEDAQAIDADAIADAFVRDLQIEDVPKWAGAVREAIGAARRATQNTERPDADATDARRQAIVAQINELRKQLRQIDAGCASASSRSRPARVGGDSQ